MNLALITLFGYFYASLYHHQRDVSANKLPYFNNHFVSGKTLFPNKNRWFASNYSGQADIGVFAGKNIEQPIKL